MGKKVWTVTKMGEGRDKKNKIERKMSSWKSFIDMVSKMQANGKVVNIDWHMAVVLDAN